MGYMYACHLKKPLNIFNPHNRVDEVLFRKSKDISQEEFNKLKEEHWLQLMGEDGREEILNHLRNLGYDGFFNFEHNKEGAALGIFDVDNISILRIYKGYKEIDDFIQKNKELAIRKQRQIEALKSGYIKIYPSMFSFKEISSVLGDVPNIEEHYENILRERRKEKRNCLEERFSEYKILLQENKMNDSLLKNYIFMLEDYSDLLKEKGYYTMKKWKDF